MDLPLPPATDGKLVQPSLNYSPVSDPDQEREYFLEYSRKTSHDQYPGDFSAPKPYIGNNEETIGLNSFSSSQNPELNIQAGPSHSNKEWYCRNDFSAEFKLDAQIPQQSDFAHYMPSSYPEQVHQQVQQPHRLPHLPSDQKCPHEALNYKHDPMNHYNESQTDAGLVQIHFVDFKTPNDTIRRKSSGHSVDSPPSLPNTEKRLKRIERYQKERTDMSESKRIESLARNRAAASKCRQKRKKLESGLEVEYEEAKATHARRTLEITELKEEIFQLKTKMLDHNNCECNAIRNYICHKFFKGESSDYESFTLQEN